MDGFNNDLDQALLIYSDDKYFIYPVLTGNHQDTHKICFPGILVVRFKHYLI